MSRFIFLLEIIGIISFAASGAMLAGLIAIVTIRLLSVHFRWNLPNASI